MGVLRSVVRWWASVPAFVRWGLVAAEVVVLWWSSSREQRGVAPSVLGSLLHNSAHVVAYAVLAGLVLTALRGTRPWRRVDAVVAIAIAGGYGIIDEIHQSFVPGRVCSFADIAADVAGATLAGCLLLGLEAEQRVVRKPILIAGGAALFAVLAATFLPW